MDNNPWLHGRLDPLAFTKLFEHRAIQASACLPVNVLEPYALAASVRSSSCGFDVCVGGSVVPPAACSTTALQTSFGCTLFFPIASGRWQRIPGS